MEDGSLLQSVNVIDLKERILKRGEGPTKKTEIVREPLNLVLRHPRLALAHFWIAAATASSTNCDFSPTGNESRKSEFSSEILN